jgi:HAD superfamily hydrolase (TIGR01549 family)
MATVVRPIGAVLFDFHGTLAQLESLDQAVEHAASACGLEDRAEALSALASALLDSGWVGSTRPARIPAALEAAWERRDLTEADHRAAFVGLAEHALRAASSIDGFATAIYERMRSPEGWVAYADTVATLTAVRSAGVPTALVSNIGFDARPILKHLGIDHLLDRVLLSFEVGVMKPDPGIFAEACRQLGVDPVDTLMVGDTDADGAARGVGIRTLLLPHAGPGDVVGLDAVRVLVEGR